MYVHCNGVRLRVLEIGTNLLAIAMNLFHLQEINCKNRIVYLWKKYNEETKYTKKVEILFAFRHYQFRL